MIIKKRNYSVKELKEIFGENFLTTLGLKSAIERPSKPVINNFEEFDEPTKNIYQSIRSFIDSLNTDKNFEVFATGSRVNGRWLTKEEADVLSEEYGVKVKESDYDYYTTAEVKPSNADISSQLGVRADHSIGSRQILIPGE